MRGPEVLVIGVDAGDARIIRGLELPTLCSLMDDCHELDVTEDLWNRGWTSILSGRHGVETGAFYEKPALDGTHRFTQGFGTDGYVDNPDIEPLWSSLNAAGKKVGFFNVPTTMPAPEVNGFLVAGAGGGYSPAGGIPEPAVYPESDYADVVEWCLDWETRFRASGETDFVKLAKRASESVRRRARAFVRLVERHRPDFGFFVQKETATLQNLALWNIRELMDDTASSDCDPDVQRSLNNFYAALDKSIEHVIESTNPAEIMVVSDHASELCEYECNVNHLLERRSYLRYRASSSPRLSHLLRTAPERLPRSLRRLGRAVVGDGAARSLATWQSHVDWDDTLAFGARYVPGVYINDHRFDGPVDESRTASLVEEIVSALNQDEDLAGANCSASPYRERFDGARHKALLPDVWIEHPDSIFFEATGPLLNPNPLLGPVPRDVSWYGRDLATGIKGRRPLALVSDGIAERVDGSETDLRAIYRLLRAACR